MNPKLLLCLALVLSGGLIGCEVGLADGNATNAGPSSQSTTRLYRGANNGLEFVVPDGWTARKADFDVAHYSCVFLTVNNQRPALEVRDWQTGRNGMEFGPEATFQQMHPGEVYVSFGFFGYPGPETMRADTVGDDLHSLLTATHFSTYLTNGLSELDLSFFKHGHPWFISADMKNPVTEENRQKVMAMLRDIRFLEAPVDNASWAESLAWNELPENVRDTEDWLRGWPAVGQEGEQSGFGRIGQRSVVVTNLGPAYSITFTLKGIGEWRYRVATNGEVESEPPIVHVAGPPRSQWPSDLPGASKGTIDVSWIAPHVQATKAFGKTTVTWFAKDGRVERQATVIDVNPTSGFVEIVGHPNVMEGMNEDWCIAPRKVVLQPGSLDECYAESTPDSRVFVYQYNSKPGTVGLDIYIHGKHVNTFGPFFLQYPSHEVVLNDDGSAALLIAKTNLPFNLNAPGKDGNTLRNEISAIHRLPAQIVVLNTNGEVRFKAECGNTNWDPNVAPNGAGVLLRPGSGTNPNTFMWFTEKGELHSMDIGPNPQCIGWIPQTCQSLFLTQLGYETTHVELIDWSVGKQIWKIPSPGDGELLAVGLTPKLIIFSVAEPYPSGVWHKVNESLFQSGQEWVRTFYAVDVQDGKLVARWRGQFPHGDFDASRDHFLRLGGKLFYIAADEFTEFNFEDILAKRNGWQ